MTYRLPTLIVCLLTQMVPMVIRPMGGAMTAGVAVGVAEGVVAALAGPLHAMATPAAASEPARAAILLIRLIRDIDAEHDASGMRELREFSRFYLFVKNLSYRCHSAGG